MPKYTVLTDLQPGKLEILFLLIPLSILIAIIIAAFFFWSVKSGQFDDMQGPAHSILMDDDEIETSHQASNKSHHKSDSSTTKEETDNG